jgi:putative oxidoreductase
MANVAHPHRTAGAAIHVDAGAWVLLFARICFASDFLLFGGRKLSDPSVIYRLIEAHHLPGELVYPTIALQLGCGFLVLVGFQARLAAAMLGWFCIVAPSIFWLDNLENLSRDYAAAGGLMLLCLFGPGRLSVDASLRNGRDLIAPLARRVVDNQVLLDRVMLAARALVAFPFIADVVTKILFIGQQRALFEAAGMPGGAIYIVMAIELLCGLTFLAGYRVRLAALVLLAWSAVLALTIHNPSYEFAIFTPDFGAAVARNFYNRAAATFFKDITTIGSLLTVIACDPARSLMSWNASQFFPARPARFPAMRPNTEPAIRPEPPG